MPLVIIASDINLAYKNGDTRRVLTRLLLNSFLYDFTRLVKYDMNGFNPREASSIITRLSTYDL